MFGLKKLSFLRTLYDAAQFEHDNNKKDENESVVAQSQKVTFIQNQNEKFNYYRAQESSQFLSSLLLNTILLLLKKIARPGGASRQA